MDNITLLGVVGSVVSIVSLFIAIFTSNSKTNISSNNKIKINESFNSNSYYKVTNNYNVQNNYERPYPSKQREYSQGKSNDEFWGIAIISIIILGAILKFYTNYQEKIVFYVIVEGIIGFTINMICILLINRRISLPRLFLYFNTVKWFPLFIMLIFIYRPIYSSHSLIDVKRQLMGGTGFLSVFMNNQLDVLFYLFQFLGLLLIAVIIMIFLFMSVYDFYSLYFKGEDNLNEISRRKIITYFSVCAFVFIIISGTYVYLIEFLTNLSTNKDLLPKSHCQKAASQ